LSYNATKQIVPVDYMNYLMQLKENCIPLNPNAYILFRRNCPKKVN